MAGAAELQIVITGNTADAKRAMRDLVGEAEKTESAFKRISETAAGVFAANVFQRGLSELVGGLKGVVASADEAAKTQAQLSAVLRSTHGAAGMTLQALNDMAQGLQRTTTYSDEAVGHAQALLLTFTNIKDNVFPQTTQAVLDMSTALGQDLQSSAVMVGKALQSPIDGVTALRRVGVQLTDDQEKLITKFVESGNVMEAQKIILGELATEFGGSAAAATETFGGKLAQLNNKFDDMKEVIGKAIIDAALPALNSLSDWFSGHQSDIENFFKGIVRAGEDLAKGLAEGLKAVTEALSWIPNNQGAIVAGVAAVGVAMAAAFGPASLAFIGLAGIVKMIGDVSKNGIDLPFGLGTIGGKDQGPSELAQLYAYKSLLETGDVPAGQKDALHAYQGSGNIDEINRRITQLESGTSGGQPGPGVKGFDIDEWLKQFQRTGYQVNGLGNAASKGKTALEELSDLFSKINGTTRERADLEVRLAELELQKVTREQAAEDRAKSFEIANNAVAARNKAAGIFDMYQWNQMNGMPAPGTFNQPGNGKSSLDAQIEQVKKNIEIEQKRTELLDKQFKAANRNLLTDDQRDKVAGQLIEQERRLTTQSENLGDAMLTAIRKANSAADSAANSAKLAGEFLASMQLAISPGRTRDSGGPVSAGTSYLIGRGAQPELFVPSSSGHMYPAGSYGGMTVNVYVAGSVLSDRDLLQKIRDGLGGGALYGVLEAAA